MKVVAFITDSKAVDRIIDHLSFGLWPRSRRRRMSSNRSRSWRPRSGRNIFKDIWFREASRVYRLLGDFPVVPNEDLAGGPASQPFLRS
jgi:hypothetical protein